MFIILSISIRIIWCCSIRFFTKQETAEMLFPVFLIAIIYWHTYAESATESCILELSVQALLQTEILYRHIKYYLRKETVI